MSTTHEVTIDGNSFTARRGEILLDAALRNGVDLPFDCRAGHCGTCCVRLVEGGVRGGEGAKAGVVHACQCRIAGDIVIEKRARSSTRTVEGELVSLRPLSREATEVRIRIADPMPHHAGQYAQVRFSGFPSRPFSLTQPLLGNAVLDSLYFHIRPMKQGHVTRALGRRIGPGHRVSVTGPFGSAYFRANGGGRLVLVGTSTGFAPIWSVAIAALRENPERLMMVIAGGRSVESLYMTPALARLMRFPNVYVVPVCSAPNVDTRQLRQGRPTDYLPRLLPSDEVYACGAPGMVDTVRSIAAHYGAACYADPFLRTSGSATDGSVLARAKGWFAEAALGRPRIVAQAKTRRKQLPAAADRVIEIGPRGHFQP